MKANSKPALRCRMPFVAVGLLCLLAGCEETQPTSFAEFMDDEIAREGTLARCNEDREATATDIECANARRAAAAIALREERARREALELESERKLAELRAQMERERAAAREAQLVAEAAARAAYDAQWEARDGEAVGVDGEPIREGAVIGVDGLPISDEDAVIGVDGLPITDEGAVSAPAAAVPAGEAAGLPADSALETQ